MDEFKTQLDACCEIICAATLLHNFMLDDHDYNSFGNNFFKQFLNVTMEWMIEVEKQLILSLFYFFYYNEPKSRGTKTNKYEEHENQKFSCSISHSQKRILTNNLGWEILT